MHTRTTAATLTGIALLLTATACSSSNDNASPDAAAATSTPATYDPAAWHTRIDQLITQLDQAQPDCTTSPSSQACADALHTADDTALAMQQDIHASGDTAGHPATYELLGQIVNGYKQYEQGNCAGSPEADGQGSECRAATVLVLLGVATLPAKMTQDGD